MRGGRGALWPSTCREREGEGGRGRERKGEEGLQRGAVLKLH